MRDFAGSVERVVVKVGTGFIIDELDDEGYGVNDEQIHAICSEVADINTDKKGIAIVSSGAIGTAASVLDLEKLPEDPMERAQLAGEGQPHLFMHYQQRLKLLGQRCAQCLITHDDVAIRKRRRNLRANQEGYFRDGVIAIYNENDFVATDDITFGDNDILAALVARELDADLMVMLSYGNGPLGTGGENSKQRAARILAQKNIPLVIINERYGKTDGDVVTYQRSIQNVLAGEDVGNLLEA